MFVKLESLFFFWGGADVDMQLCALLDLDFGL